MKDNNYKGQKYLQLSIIMPYNTYIDLGVYFNGRMPVSKTVNVGSTPTTPAKLLESRGNTSFNQ